MVTFYPTATSGQPTQPQPALLGRNWVPFALVAGTYLLLALGSNYILVSDNLYAVSLANQMNSEQIQHMVELNHQWAWLAYILLPMWLFVKFILVAAVLATGYYIVADKWQFRAFFRIAIQAEAIFIVAAIVRLLWFGWLHQNYQLVDLQYYYPLSASSLMNFNEVATWLRYPLQLANVFELLYWLILAIGIKQLLGLPMTKASQLVALSYGPALLIWLLFVMFLTVSFA